MRVYGDTSFLVKLVTEEAGSTEAMSEFRRLDFPPLYFLSVHKLEVANAIRQRAFHLGRSAPSGQRASIARAREAGLARIDKWLARGWLAETAADHEAAF